MSASSGIYLRGCYYRHGSPHYLYLVYIIESAKHLEKFIYGIGGHSSWNGMLMTFHLERVFWVLFAHQASLCQLDLVVEGETYLLDLNSLWYSKYTPEEEEHESAWDNPVYLHKWADELEKVPAEDEQRPSDFLFSSEFLQLKDLSLGVHILYLYACGYGSIQLDSGSFSLVDHLPPNLVSLRIYGYKKGMRPRLKGFSQNSLEDQLAKLMAAKDEKLPRLAIVEGIEEPIPNGETI
ncbi:LOW QUALITY PROTEIN: conserved hypothetical protein [Aspergillus udagawae]|uniref:Uncharacterized protein n=1 Tax=Aspergillus udagawae TaxID=91492 RepID=A0A8H3SGC6_9EURO|nr:LOW QUALITY PROTEIN: conserved hypothetical protein [Aspergillus udagawae]